MREQRDKPSSLPQSKIVKNTRPKHVKIGVPGYKVVKQQDPDSNQKSLLFEIDFPQISKTDSQSDIKPAYRLMSTFEQNKEAVDPRYQYILFAAHPYETIAFKVPSNKVDFGPGKFME